MVKHAERFRILIDEPGYGHGRGRGAEHGVDLLIKKINIKYNSKPNPRETGPRTFVLIIADKGQKGRGIFRISLEREEVCLISFSDIQPEKQAAVGSGLTIDVEQEFDLLVRTGGGHGPGEGPLDGLLRG